jgi:hypothetical protein
VSVLGRAYLLAGLLLLLIGVAWGAVTLTMHENANTWVEVVLLVPRLDLVDPFEPKRFQMSVPGMLSGWAIAIGLVALLGLRAPFIIRRAAVTQRRTRELEREVLELRTLPLRQQEEDEVLAAEAHLDVRAGKVMTEKLRREELEAAGLTASAGAKRGPR